LKKIENTDSMNSVLKTYSTKCYFVAINKINKIMAKQCAICEKTGRMVGKRIKFRGKYNPTVKTRKYPNLQWLKVPLDVSRPAYKKYAGKRVLACTKCIKALSKLK